jgi:hypothetical protein
MEAVQDRPQVQPRQSHLAADSVPGSAMTPAFKRILWGLAVLLAIPIALLLNCRFRPPLTGQARFDRVVWLRSNPGDRDSPRMKMIDDLGRRILLPGSDKSAVLTELGKPERVELPEKFGPGALPPEIDFVWNYPVGSWSGWRMDTDYLAVGFSSKGKVVEHWIWQS